MKFITENQLKGDKGEPKPMVRLSGASCLGPWGCLSGGPAGGNRLLRRGRRGRSDTNLNQFLTCFQQHRLCHLLLSNILVLLSVLTLNVKKGAFFKGYWNNFVRLWADCGLVMFAITGWLWEMTKVGGCGSTDYMSPFAPDSSFTSEILHNSIKSWDSKTWYLLSERQKKHEQVSRSFITFFL